MFFNHNELQDILSCIGIPTTKYPYFVETGTYDGDVTIDLSENMDVIKDLFSIEISEYRYNKAVENLKNHSNITNIHLIHGDSVDKLEEVCNNIQDNCIFYLDAHPSGENTEFSEKNVNPILCELELITKHHKKSQLIIINDVRLFSKYWDWENITIDAIRNVINRDELKNEDRSIKIHFVHNDRYVILFE